LKEALEKKYGFNITVSEPSREAGRTETWKIRIVTRPERPDFPAQRINIDICMLPSHDRKPAMLQNQYGIEMGTAGMILFAESSGEILADKLIAFAMRPNRVKNRDLWDIVWLRNQAVPVSVNMLKQKLSDRNIRESAFEERYRDRLKDIAAGQRDFLREMRRFLPPQAFTADFTGALWWEYLLGLLGQVVNT